MTRLNALLILAAVTLSGCGGGGGGSGNSGSPSAGTDAFTASVQQVVATSPDDAEPLDVESISVTETETAEPANL